MEATGKKVTVQICFLAVVKTLMKHPYINASLTDDGKPSSPQLCQFGNGSWMDNGLLTLVVYNAERWPCSEAGRSLQGRIGRTLDGVAPSELQIQPWSVILGMFGVRQSFGPIINQPNSAILGVSSTAENQLLWMVKLSFWSNHELGLTIDHQVLNDGMVALNLRGTALIEDPISMLV